MTFGSPSRIAITGVAAVASLGSDAESIWQGIKSGRCGMGPMPDIELPFQPTSLGGQALDLPSEYCPELPRETRYLRWTVEQALRDAGADDPSPYLASRRCAVIGTTMHGIRAGGRYLRTGQISELNSFLAGSVCHKAFDGLGIQGGHITTSSACSSSLSAISLGVTLLETGQADLVIAGGYDVISEYSWAGFNSLRLMAQGSQRPFCRNREGMKVAEGYGLVVLERASPTLRQGARVHAWLTGWGESADAHHLTKPHPHGDGALSAMSQALSRASKASDQIDMVAAHATGTPDNDESEYYALSRLFGKNLPSVPVIGFKSFLGHTLGGAGAVELIMSCLALRDQCVPACPNIEKAEIEYADLDVPVGTTAEHRLNVTLNMSLGFGGANNCIVLSSPDEPPPPASAAIDPRPCPWITGVGVMLPGAVGHVEFGSLIRDAHNSDTHSLVKDVEESLLNEYLHARRVRRFSLPVKLTLAAANMAVQDAGLDSQSDMLEDACAILGSMHGSADFCYEYYSQIVNKGAMAANPVLFAEGVPNAAAAHLSVMLGIKGSCQTIIGSRTAGLDALALAALRIRSGAVKTVIVAVADAPSEHVDLVYSASGLYTPRRAELMATAGSEFQSAPGGMAFIVESDQEASSRGVRPYAKVIESSWASTPSRDSGGPAASVASAMSRISNPGTVLGSSCGTWIERAEVLGMRRAGLPLVPSPVQRCFGETHSVAPLASLASTLVTAPTTRRCTVLTMDWTGVTSAVCIEHEDRRMNGF